MKNRTSLIVLLLIFFVGSQAVKAQYYTLPDTNFRNTLKKQFPGCFNAKGQLDTTCVDVLETTSLSVQSAGIYNLQGINYFSSLTTLICSVNNLSALPALPTTLNYLDCSENQITSLPALPGSLNYLYCSANQLASLPALPASLLLLYVPINQLVSLPALPSRLQYLFCDSNHIQCLPTLDSSLQTLYASQNPLSCIPNLPPHLTSSDISLTVCTAPCGRSTGVIATAPNYSEITIMPNPSTGLVIIQTNFPLYASSNLQVQSMQGKLVYQLYDVDLSAPAALDFSGLPKGLYVMQISAGDLLFTEKLALE